MRAVASSPASIFWSAALMLRSAVGELYKEGVRDADSSEEMSEVESEYTSTPNLGISPRAQSHQFQGGRVFYYKGDLNEPTRKWAEELRSTPLNSDDGLA